MPHTLEGKIVRLSDKIAYINSDFDDAIRAQLLCEDDIPLEIRKTLGFDTKSRLNHMIHNIITNSMDKDDICLLYTYFPIIFDAQTGMEIQIGGKY